MGYVLLTLLDHSVSLLKVRMLKDEFLPTCVEGRGEKFLLIYMFYHQVILNTGKIKDFGYYCDLQVQGRLT